MSILTTAFFKKDNIIIELENLEIDQSERDKLLQIAEELAELRLLDSILEKLKAEDKELFLQRLHTGPQEIFVEFLREKIENFEEILNRQAQILEKEILDDIRSLKG